MRDLPRRRTEKFPTLGWNSLEEYQEQSTDAIEAYDRVQADYAGARATTSWSQRLAEQFGQAEPSSTRKNLEQKKLL